MPRFTRPLTAGVAAVALLAGMAPAVAELRLGGGREEPGQVVGRHPVVGIEVDRAGLHAADQAAHQAAEPRLVVTCCFLQLVERLLQARRIQAKHAGPSWHASSFID